jgi:hypothetical protein
MNHTLEPDEDDVRYGPALEWNAPNLTLEQKQALVEGWVLHELLGGTCGFLGELEVAFPCGLRMTVEYVEGGHDVKIYCGETSCSPFFRPSEGANRLAEVFFERRYKDAVEGAVRAIHLSKQF